MLNITNYVSSLSETVSSPIDPNTIRHLFAISSWQSILALTLLILGTVLMILIWRKKGIKSVYIIGALITVVVSLLFGLFSNLFASPTAPTGWEEEWVTWESEVILWFDLYWNIFFLAISFIIPLLIFVNIIYLINKDRHESKVTPGSFFKSSFALSMMVMLGIVIAMSMSWFFSFIKIPATESTEALPDTSVTIPGIIDTAIPSSFAIFTSIEFILATVTAGVFFGFALKYLHNKKHNVGEPIISFFETFHVLIAKYIKVISYLIPFAVVYRFPILFMFGAGDALLGLGMFVIMFFFGLTVLIVAETIVLYIFMPKQEGQSKISALAKTLPTYLAIAFAKHTPSILLDDTISTTKAYGVSETSSMITPTVGTSMGMSMCGGFYPTMIVIITAQLSGVDLNAAFYITLLIVVWSSSIGISGVPGTDAAIVVAALGSLGLTTDYYATLYVFDGILNIFRGLGNAVGFLAATVMYDRLFDKEIEIKEEVKLEEVKEGDK